MPAKKSTTKAKKTTQRTKTSAAKKETTQKITKTPTIKEDKKGMVTSPVTKKAFNLRAILIGGLILLIVALALYKFAPWFVPAWVNNKPITRIELYQRLETAYGAQTMEDLINEQVLADAVRESGVDISQERIDGEIAQVEEQFANLGGLDAALEARGMTRAQLEEQIKTQLAVEEILKDQIQPTEEEINTAYEEGKDTLYQDQELDAVRDQIREQVRQEKLRDAFLAWFANVKQEANVRNLYSQ